MFEGIKRNIRQAAAKLRDLNIGRTQAKRRAARERKNRAKRAIREFLDEKEKALTEYDKLIRQGRDEHDDHLRNLYVRAMKADNHADELGPVRAGFARNFRTLSKVLDDKTDARRRLEKRMVSARKNLRQKRREYERQHQQAPQTGVGTYDGKPIAAWMIPTMNAARSNGWGGTLTSGYRSPAYSTALCYQICGAPTCPGRCAGATSNHTKNARPDGAVDVSDPYGFDSAQGTLHNNLGAADPWHFSSSGY